jgi:hypothetical protein
MSMSMRNSLPSSGPRKEAEHALFTHLPDIIRTLVQNSPPRLPATIEKFPHRMGELVVLSTSADRRNSVLTNHAPADEKRLCKTKRAGRK